MTNNALPALRTSMHTALPTGSGTRGWCRRVQANPWLQVRRIAAVSSKAAGILPLQWSRLPLIDGSAGARRGAPQGPPESAKRHLSHRKKVIVQPTDQPADQVQPTYQQNMISYLGQIKLYSYISASHPAPSYIWRYLRFRHFPLIPAFFYLKLGPARGPTPPF